VTRELIRRHIPELQEKFSDLDYFIGGERQDQQEATAALGRGMIIALLVMFTVMAILFNSYAQPALILFIIPFGFIGALLGHLLLGFQISIISLFGLIALSGVVVNDSLVLVAAVNERRREKGMKLKEALQNAALRRFRPVLLTSLTTFFGLAPMIFETAVQARFLIPMALSLGFGVLFVTPITILLLPGIYHILEDFKGLLKRSP
jgi:multidrug efflux pump subunit AcrB